MKAVTIGVCLALIVSARPLSAGENYAVVVTGAAAGEEYAVKYDGWRTSFVSVFRERFSYPEDHVFVLAERESAGVLPATREGVQKTFSVLRGRLSKDDLLVVLLIGHGSSLDREDAKFNLAGPDMTATEWAAVLKGLPGRLVFIDTTSASFPFLQKIAAPGRVVLTATDSAAQEFETVFPEFLLQALDEAAADADKNGRVSVLEAFDYASAAVRRWFEQHGQLPTERALLDDTGNGVGREAQSRGPDGGLARTTYLQPVGTPGIESPRAALLARQAELEAKIEELKQRRESMSANEYQRELERLLVELARVSAEIRSKS